MSNRMASNTKSFSLQMAEIPYGAKDANVQTLNKLKLKHILSQGAPLSSGQIENTYKYLN